MRKPRQVSATGFYHVMQRGVNLFDIFENDEDRRRYVGLLQETAAQEEIIVRAWCLMSNHVHLLLQGDISNLSAMMRKLGSRYARYFNIRHGRIGHLFEDRFASVCIESDAQYLTVVRYIHSNPIVHQENARCEEYPWSSYGEYLSGNASVAETDLALDMLGGVEGFVRFHHQDIADGVRHLDIHTLGRLTDDEARGKANAALQDAGFAVNVGLIGRLPRRLRDKALLVVKSVVGCSLRQLQRLTAIAYSAIRSAMIGASAEAENAIELGSNTNVKGVSPRKVASKSTGYTRGGLAASVELKRSLANVSAKASELRGESSDYTHNLLGNSLATLPALPSASERRR